MSDVRRIVVTTNADITGDKPSLTTFREAIQEVNTYYSTRGTDKSVKYYIDFESGDSATSSWLISPEIPLPPLLYGQVYINYNSPKNVTITGDSIKAKPPTIPSNVFPRNANQYSSLMTLGNSDYLGSAKLPTSKSWSWRYEPQFFIKNVNFSSNKAQGEDGGKPGGGGGLGAGGGVSIVLGNGYFENVVFQDLQAIGGTGGAAGNSGGRGAVDDDWEGQSGSRGGSGGLPGSFVSNNWIARSEGGAGGSSGDKDRGYQAAYNESLAYSFLKGSDGKSSYSAPIFGRGGAAGGGGGGGSYFYWGGDWFGKGGKGGSGSPGGFGAGGGGGGGAGNNAFAAGASANSSGSGGRGGEFASAGSSGEWSYVSWRGGYSSLWSEERTYTGVGGHGAALGGALALLHPSNASAELVNVDFINNTATSKAKGKYNILFSRSKLPGSVSGRSVDIYDSYDSDSPLSVVFDKSLDNPDFHAFIASRPKDTRAKFLYEATSYPRNDKLAKIRDPFISLSPGKPETSVIRFERPKSTITPINIDASGVENEINDIYKRIIPVESEEDIKSRLRDKQLSAVMDLGLGFVGLSGAQDLFKASNNNYTKSDRNKSMAIGAASSIGKFAFSMFNAQTEYENEIKINNENIKLLADKTRKDRTLVTAEPIDIGQARSLITIENFTVGEDVLYLDDFGFGPGRNGRVKYGPKITTGSVGRDADGRNIQSFEIHLNNDGNTNTATRIANVSLDPRTTEVFSNGKITSPIAYLNSLLRYDSGQNRWVLGKTMTDANYVFQESLSYVGGPAGELKVLTRTGGLQNDQVMTTETHFYDDIVYGTDGNENIFTSSGNDQVFPGLGNDTVNAGDSFDKVDYQSIKAPINVVGSQADDINSKSRQDSVFNVRLVNSDSSSALNSRLLNTEAIAAFGPSVFDLDKLPAPNKMTDVNIKDEQEGYYAIRTGSGSTIEGSKYQSSFIISMMSDENPSDFLVSEKLDDNFDILKKPAIVTGNSKDDSLLFSFDGKSPSLNLAKIEAVPQELNGYQAVIKDKNLVIAFVKGFDHVSVAGDGDDVSSGVLFLDDTLINLQYISAGELRAIKSQKPRSDSVILDANDLGDSELGIGNSKPEFVKLGGREVFHARAGSDIVRGQSGDDVITGGKGSDHLSGGKGGDDLQGGVGGDTLVGGKGDDVLRGNSGDDVIHGGAGTNTVKGGAGYDTFVLKKGGYQKILDFDPMQDTLQMSGKHAQDDLSIDDDNVILHKGSPIGELA